MGKSILVIGGTLLILAEGQRVCVLPLQPLPDHLWRSVPSGVFALGSKPRGQRISAQNNVRS